MRVSVIIPVYNVAPYIVRCLESVRNQTYKDLEVFLVDDCGTDNSMQLAREYLASHTFPEYRLLAHTVNRGPSAAKNTALDVATGEYVFFLDSDDEITPDCIEKLVKPLDNRFYEVVMGNYKEVHADHGLCGVLVQEGEISEPLKTYMEDDCWPVTPWNKLCHREFLLKNRLYFKEGMFHEDVVWNFQLACKVKHLYFLSDCTYIYYVREASIMTSMSIEKDVSIYVQAFKEIKSFILSENLVGNCYVYQFTEGKISGILYSLLQKGENALYNRYYPLFREQNYISPWTAYKNGLIEGKYLLRDFHHCLPVPLGRIYKKTFYLLFYKLRGKKIEGAVWK